MRREVWKCMLLVFTNRSCHYSEYLTWTIDDDRLITRIRGNQLQHISILLEILERHIALKRSNHDIAVLRDDRTIEYHDISLDDTSILHAISFYPTKIGGSWVIDEIGFKIHLRCRMILRSEWQSRTN